jgi:hypothetical protein
MLLLAIRERFTDVGLSGSDLFPVVSPRDRTVALVSECGSTGCLHPERRSLGRLPNGCAQPGRTGKATFQGFLAVVEVLMNFTRFNDFSELYRAAFAETDDQKKLSLLHEVERVINRYRVESEDEANLTVEVA